MMSTVFPPCLARLDRHPTTPAKEDGPLRVRICSVCRCICSHYVCCRVAKYFRARLPLGGET